MTVERIYISLIYFTTSSTQLKNFDIVKDVKKRLMMDEFISFQSMFQYMWALRFLPKNTFAQLLSSRKQEKEIG